ncbi:unnamed protein product (macronuclear) [Paramecium tetraurelia]|uniref:CCT domain-containing protein n=1 Tax=Paramecium tetraurelia TaxID=5888 RepID=A0EB54_PARTE|nr:uncharacterized protein GSPATT00025255001 [Paramecium tetraurelia]CAK92521.1 unnamed protein product [Paramecium tetraurelia]|eukprot:XP_001459918.1 hypothetical protein (macronuclear) [Paramecium tetraurelia strain d4-2]
MNSQQQGFKLYNSTQNNEIINKRRKLSIGSEGSDSTGEKLNESFNRLTLSAGNPQSSFQPFVKIPITQVRPPERPLTHPSLMMGIQKYLKLGEDLEAEDLLTKPYNDLQQIQNLQQLPQQRLHFIPFGMPANYEKLMSEAKNVLQSEIKVEEERQKRNIDDYLIEQKLLNPGQKLSKEERAAKVKAYLEKKHNRLWKQVRYPVRKNLAEFRERVQGRFTKSEKPRFNQSLILLDKEERKMETLTNSYA